MERKRLTARVKQSEDKTMYPGRVNQEDRPTVDIRKYDNYVEQPGWETQDLHHDWKDNPRDEVGMGIPKIAAIYATSQQAVRLATLFLGDKVKESMIEAQARDFMRLGARRIQASLERFNTSSTLYAEDQDADGKDQSVNTPPEVDKAAQTAPVVSEEKKEEAPAAAPAPVAPVAPVAAVKKAEEAPAAPVVEPPAAAPAPVAEDKAPEAPAAAPAPVASAKKATDLVDLPQTTPVEPTTPVAEDDADEAGHAEPDGDECPTAEDDADADEGLAIEMGEELDMTNADDDEDADDTEIASVFADEQMDSACAEDDSKGEVVAHKTASKKAGIKKLGGNLPKVSTKVASVDELTGVWSDAPDVTSIF